MTRVESITSRIGICCRANLSCSQAWFARSTLLSKATHLLKDIFDKIISEPTCPQASNQCDVIIDLNCEYHNSENGPLWNWMKSHRLLQVPETLQRYCQSIMGCVCDQPCKSPKVSSTFSRVPQTLRRSRTGVCGWPVCCLVDLFQGLRKVFKPDRLTYCYTPGRYVTGRCCQCVTLAPLTCFGRSW